VGDCAPFYYPWLSLTTLCSKRGHLPLCSSPRLIRFMDYWGLPYLCSITEEFCCMLICMLFACYNSNRHKPVYWPCHKFLKIVTSLMGYLVTLLSLPLGISSPVKRSRNVWRNATLYHGYLIRNTDCTFRLSASALDACQFAGDAQWASATRRDIREKVCSWREKREILKGSNVYS
jgi:hypothetical protein